DAVDGAWNRIDCAVPPGEGLYWAGEDSKAGPVPSEFARYSGAGLCTIEFWPPGIAFDAAPGSMVWELAVDLVASELNKAGGGDCF
ncbi:MAG: hypothetical protein GTO63_34240, partial [Anaerolineae bacterium]|nr:hypothetical protein [Anaerolineae bacterium]